MEEGLRLDHTRRLRAERNRAPGRQSCRLAGSARLGQARTWPRCRVIDEAGREAPVGEVGEVALWGRTPSLFLEYWKNPGESKACWRGEFYLTGDRAYRDEQGYFWFVGRGDDVIISAGYRIGPFEVESALLTHPAVLESAVVASPDPVRGSVVKAFIKLRPQHVGSEDLQKQIQDHVKRITAPYKYPRGRVRRRSAGRR
jgi:acyl-coenzyme A synthetase/AMP-(fatty) acid ligase